MEAHSHRGQILIELAVCLFAFAGVLAAAIWMIRLGEHHVKKQSFNGGHYEFQRFERRTHSIER